MTPSPVSHRVSLSASKTCLHTQVRGLSDEPYTSKALLPTRPICPPRQYHLKTKPAMRKTFRPPRSNPPNGTVSERQHEDTFHDFPRPVSTHAGEHIFRQRRKGSVKLLARANVRAAQGTNSTLILIRQRRATTERVVKASSLIDRLPAESCPIPNAG